MTLAQFKSAPWKTQHDVYRNSPFAIQPAPEYASSEVLVAATYRAVGLDPVSEGSVPKAGREFDKRVQKTRERGERNPGGTVEGGTWNTIIHGVLESPKLPNQSSKRFLQMSPLVPDVARYSGSARLSGNSWPAGSLIRRMVWLGSRSHVEAQELWNKLFSALEVTPQDDVFARWLQQEFESWRDKDSSSPWSVTDVEQAEFTAWGAGGKEDLQYPARQFVHDLGAVVQAKEWMTRRQWTSLLEAVMRLAAVSHVVWLCAVQDKLWQTVDAILSGDQPLDPAKAAEAVFPQSLQYMSYSNPALPAIRDYASKYLLARLGLNATLWSLNAIGVDLSGPLSSGGSFFELFDLTQRNKDKLVAAGIRQSIAELVEQEARTLLCRKGIGSNLYEFARHVLGQRQTANEILRGYDQGYVLKKKGEHNSAPWVVSLGPVSVIALVHCCLNGIAGPRSVQRLCQHLAAYGISIDSNDIAKNDLGQQLRMLGLVLDSPDAENGMLLLPPFARRTATKKTIS